MRPLLRGLLLAGVASPAFAGDIDNSWLRGSSSFPADPPPLQRWNGLYGGVQAGADFRAFDFRSATGNALANIMSQDSILNTLPVTSMPALPSFVKFGPSYGGFLGYNYQIDDVVFGLEANFNWSNITESVKETQQRSFIVNQNGHVYAPTIVTVTDTAAATLNDYGSFRMRAGWAYGSFLPYVFTGVSVAQVSTSRSSTVTWHGTDNSPPCGGVGLPCNDVGGSLSQGDQSHGKFSFGFSFGAGVDYALTRNLFLRGEVEYLALSAVNDIKLNSTTVRAGAGLKF